MTPNSLPRLRPAASLLCLAVLVALASPAESRGRPYLLVQHQVYEEHQEVLGKGNRNATEYRKNDEEELFDFIKDYLFRRGGAKKLNSRNGNGRAQFVGIDSGGAGGSANGSAASGGALEAKESGQSGQRYKMHIIKFRLVNASHPAIAAAVRNAQVMKISKKGDNAPQESLLKERQAKGGQDNSTMLARSWSGRTIVGYRTSHPTHVTTARTEQPPAPPRRAAPVAPVNCELPETTTTTTKRTTTTTRRRTTTTTKTTTTTTTTAKPTTTTTTKRTTTCAPTTVAVVGCEREPPPTTKRRTSTTTAAPQVYLHGHPYVVIKLHEVKGTPRPQVNPYPPLPLYLRSLLANGTYPEGVLRTRNISSHLPEYRFWFPGASLEESGGANSGKVSEHQLKGKKKQQQPQQRPRSRRVPAYAAETAALKREVAGNLMRVLRTIRELDSMAQHAQQDDQQQEQVQEEQPQPYPVQQQASFELVAPDTAKEIDQFLRRRDTSQGLRSQKKWNTEYQDELKENRAEEGDLHQFSILLKKALDELSVPSDAKTRTTSKPHKAAAAAYR